MMIQRAGASLSLAFVLSSSLAAFSAEPRKGWSLRLEPTRRLSCDANWAFSDDGGNTYMVGSYFASKFDPEGREAWHFRHDGVEFQDAACDPSGNLYVTYRSPESERDFIARYDSDGRRRWELQWPGDVDGIPGWIMAIGAGPDGALVLGQDGLGRLLAVKVALEGVEAGEVLWKFTFEDFLWEGGGSAAVDLGVGGSYIVADHQGNGEVLVFYRSSTADHVWGVRHGGEDLRLSVSAAAPAPDGGLYVIANGQSFRGDQEVHSIVTVRFDGGGRVLWERSFESPDGAWCIPWAAASAPDPDGRLAVGGSAGSDFLTLLYGPEGDLLWSARRKGESLSSESGIRSVALDADGGVYAAGNSMIPGGSSGDIPSAFVVKYGPSGEELWTVERGSEGQEALLCAILSSSPGHSTLVLRLGGCYRDPSCSGEPDMSRNILRLGPSGAEVWSAKYGCNQVDQVRVMDMGLDGAGNIYLAGIYDVCRESVIKVGPGGEVRWSRSVPMGWDLQHKGFIAVDPSGNAYIAGEIYGENGGYRTVKLDPEGRELWTAEFWEAGWVSMPWQIGLAAGDGVYVTGYMSSRTDAISKCVTIKYGADGTELWRASFDRSQVQGQMRPNVLAVDSSGRIWVAGDEVNWTRLCWFPDFLLCYDGSGKEIYAKSSCSNLESAWSWIGGIAVDGSGNAYIAGDINRWGYDPEFGKPQIFAGIRKVDLTGQVLWTYELEGYGIFANTGDIIALDPEGNILSIAVPQGPDISHWLVVKIDASGKLIWQSRYVPPQGFGPVALAVDPLGAIYVTGGSQNEPGMVSTVKFSAAGEILWSDSESSSCLWADAKGILAAGNGEVFAVASFLYCSGSPEGFNLLQYLPDSDLGPSFIRGDANGDGGLDISDGVKIIFHLFAAGSEPGCLEAADADDSGAVEITDAIDILSLLFLNSSIPPPAPFPGCGIDPTPDGLTCGSSPACP